MSDQKTNYDGALISELGVKRYLKGVKAQSFSNIGFFMRGSALNTAWKECNLWVSWA